MSEDKKDMVLEAQDASEAPKGRIVQLECVMTMHSAFAPGAPAPKEEDDNVER